MTFRDFSRALRRSALLLVLITLLGGALGAGYGLAQTPRYASSSQLFLSVGGAAGADDATRQDTLYLQQRMQSYAAVLSSPALGARVADATGLGKSGAAIAGEILVTAPEGTVLLDLYVEDTSASVAQQIATAVGTEFPRLLADLENRGSTSVDAVQVTTLRPATLPTTPVSPHRVELALLGLALGLAAGIGLALLRDTLDDRIRDEDDLRALGLPDLVSVVLRTGGRRRAAHAASPGHGGALRSAALRLSSPHDGSSPGGRVLTVTAPTDLLDTTPVVSELAGALAAAGRRVLVVDADLDQGRAADRWSPDFRPGAGLAEVLRGDEALASAVQRRDDGVAVLAAGARSDDQLTFRTLAAVLDAVRADADVIVLAAPSGEASPDAELCASLSDGVLLVLQRNRTHRRDARRAADVFAALGAPVRGAVIESAQ